MLNSVTRRWSFCTPGMQIYEKLGSRRKEFGEFPADKNAEMKILSGGLWIDPLSDECQSDADCPDDLSCLPVFTSFFVIKKCLSCAVASLEDLPFPAGLECKGRKAQKSAGEVPVDTDAERKPQYIQGASTKRRNLRGSIQHGPEVSMD